MPRSTPRGQRLSARSAVEESRDLDLTVFDFPEVDGPGEDVAVSAKQLIFASSSPPEARLSSGDGARVDPEALSDADEVSSPDEDDDYTANPAAHRRTPRSSHGSPSVPSISRRQSVPKPVSGVGPSRADEEWDSLLLPGSSPNNNPLPSPEQEAPPEKALEEEEEEEVVEARLVDDDEEEAEARLVEEEEEVQEVEQEAEAAEEEAEVEEEPAAEAEAEEEEEEERRERLLVEINRSRTAAANAARAAAPKRAATKRATKRTVAADRKAEAASALERAEAAQKTAEEAASLMAARAASTGSSAGGSAGGSIRRSVAAFSGWASCAGVHRVTVSRTTPQVSSGPGYLGTPPARTDVAPQLPEDAPISKGYQILQQEFAAAAPVAVADAGASTDLPPNYARTRTAGAPDAATARPTAAPDKSTARSRAAADSAKPSPKRAASPKLRLKAKTEEEPVCPVVPRMAAREAARDSAQSSSRSSPARSGRSRGETAAAPPKSDGTFVVLCRHVLESDGGCEGCELPAYHSGPHQTLMLLSSLKRARLSAEDRNRPKDAPKPRPKAPDPPTPRAKAPEPPKPSSKAADPPKPRPKAADPPKPRSKPPAEEPICPPVPRGETVPKARGDGKFVVLCRHVLESDGGNSMCILPAYHSGPHDLGLKVSRNSAEVRNPQKAAPPKPRPKAEPAPPKPSPKAAPAPDPPKPRPKAADPPKPRAKAPAEEPICPPVPRGETAPKARGDGKFVVLCRHVLEADGGNSMCILPAYHSGPHDTGLGRKRKR